MLETTRILGTLFLDAGTKIKCIFYYTIAILMSMMWSVIKVFGIFLKIWFYLVLAVLGLRCSLLWLSLVVMSEGYSLLWCLGLLWWFVSRASVVAALRSVVKAHGLRCSLHVNLPEPGIEAVFPALASGFISIVPPFLFFNFYFILEYSWLTMLC